MAAMIPSSSLLAHAFLPPPFFEMAEKEELEEKPMAAVALLVVNIFLGAIKKGTAIGVIPALVHRNFKAFDSNPGDAGCQNRALILREFLKIDMGVECEALHSTLMKVRQLVQRRKESPKFQVGSPAKFFETLFADLRISPEMEFLMHSHFLTVLRASYEVTSRGIVMTKTDISRMEWFCSTLNHVGREIRFAIAENSQHKLSLMTAERLRRALESSSLIPSKEKEVMRRMLSDEMTHLFSSDARFMPKTFLCQFFAVKSVLIRLREDRALILLKGFVKKEVAPICIFLQPAKAGDEFIPLSAEDVEALDPEAPLVVFDSVVEKSMDELLKSLELVSFTEQVLSQAACVPPFEHSSKASDIKDPEGLAEVLHYQARHSARPSAFILDHVFLSSLSCERGGKE